MALDPDLRQLILRFQENEITEYHIYHRLAASVPSEENRQILERIAEDERRHYEEWKEATETEVKPNRAKISRYTFLGRTLGITFALKLMEQGEEGAQAAYGRLVAAVPQAAAILADEDVHEEVLLAMLDEEHLRYTGSVKISWKLSRLNPLTTSPVNSSSVQNAVMSRTTSEPR